jgi:putative phosphoribosyl transferase
MIFENRTQAGELLAQAIKEKLSFREQQQSVPAVLSNSIVLGVPRGGVIVAMEVAESIGAPLDLVIARKIGAPGNPEFAIGAVSEEGDVILDYETVHQLGIPESYIEQESASEMAKIKSRMERYRDDRPYPSLEGKTVIVVDDGIATGLTMKAALTSLRKRKPSPLILAVPVAPNSTLHELSQFVDQVVCLESPTYFEAVGEFYREFGQVTDDQVRSALLRVQSATL